jgi:hypothetical protein
MCDSCDMPMVAQPLRKLSEPWKMDNRLVAVRAKNEVASVGSSRSSCATIGISQPLQHDMLSDYGRYATVREVEAKS